MRNELGEQLVALNDAAEVEEQWCVEPILFFVVGDEYGKYRHLVVEFGKRNGQQFGWRVFSEDAEVLGVDSNDNEGTVAFEGSWVVVFCFNCISAPKRLLLNNCQDIVAQQLHFFFGAYKRFLLLVEGINSMLEPVAVSQQF